jgi:hypothetical protein
MARCATVLVRTLIAINVQIQVILVSVPLVEESIVSSIKEIVVPLVPNPPTKITSLARPVQLAARVVPMV